jgi:hypothetical protein
MSRPGDREVKRVHMLLDFSGLFFITGKTRVRDRK